MLFSISLFGFADSPAAYTDLLARARIANDDLYSSLQSFVCEEQIERYKGSLSAANGKRIDTVTTRVSFENGVEHYTDVYRNKRKRAAIEELPGAWSEGEFGTLLRQTQIALKTAPVQFREYTDLEGTPAAIYGVEVTEQNSAWDLLIESSHYRIPFRAEIWLARETGQILKVERTSTWIPSHMGISEIRWGVTLQMRELNGRSWLLPKAADYTVLYEQRGRREWNEMTFSAYRRYSSETSLWF